MTFCPQKFKHCFVACCASLLDQASIKSQEDIVRRFPAELQQGTSDEGVPTTLMAIERVLTGLELSNEPLLAKSERDDFSDMPELIRANVSERMMIWTQNPTKHCLLIKEVLNDGLIVMDPSLADFSAVSWSELMAKEPMLVVLRNGRN